LIYPDGTVVDYTYTSCNQLYQVANAGPPPVVTYEYDLSGRPSLAVMENSVVTDFGYGTAGQLTAVQHRKGVAAYFDGVGYNHNPKKSVETIQSVGTPCVASLQ
jgi:hypothetical protein